MIVNQEVTAAMKLQDLYYGNIIPCQHDVRSDSEYAKHSLEFLDMCETLEKRLSVGRHAAYELVNSGEIQSFKVGKNIRIPKIIVIEYILGTRRCCL